MSSEKSTLYDGTIAVAIGSLKALAHIVSVAEAHPNSAIFLSARLLLAKMLGLEPVEYDEDSLTSYADMKTRLDEVIKTLEGVDKEVINTRSASSVTVGVGENKPRVTLSTPAYAYSAALPNIYFHVCMAYAILRSRGVPLGKSDYMDSFFAPYAS
ncbi:uncharacterized protein LMH87_008299 [Akanthomyces muscarius]|uniref:DUF1993 domain-containing protein n=1 Tax=Akanthomyces muscarius TaxID=2231603 RepID=A0A9W8QIF1_AKAMU|nr:uncharacterized protein LMH87_008299 [Akanthomyces muscarius]KAJ4159397.1 hypothetical protein LMH87_008299 [Akanthomyces muscarius]